MRFESLVFCLFYSCILFINDARAEDLKMNFYSETELETLCKNGDIQIYVPAQDLGAIQFKNDDEEACKWSFAAVNKDNFVLSNFGVYLIKENLKETEYQRFAEFILREYSISDSFYITFEKRNELELFDNYKFEIGITGGDESQLSVSNASFADSKLGTLFLFSTAPKIFKSEGSLKLKDGRSFVVAADANYLYNYVEFWHKKNAEFLSKYVRQ